MKKKLSPIIICLIPGLITALIFLIVMAMKGIWPFGMNTIDYYDMGQTNAPLYFHIWDFLHGNGPLFFTPYLDGGQNLSMGSAIQWNISVYNLFFYLIPRRLCFKSLSLFTGLRLVFMSVNMCIFLVGQKVGHDQPEDKAPVLPYIPIAMSVAYGLCGYTLTHYTIPTYLDTAALFPILMLALGRVLQNRKDILLWKKIRIKRTALYAVCLGYTTALSYYLGFMNMIFILLISGTYIFILVPKDERGEVSAKLVSGTILGLLMSAFMLLPAALQMTSSSRFNSNLQGSAAGTLKDILWSIGADMYYIKGFALFGSFLAIVFIMAGLWHCRREWKRNIFICLACFYPCALIVFESINILWHMGTYYHYPIRCGYLIPFSLIAAGTYYALRLEEDSWGKALSDLVNLPALLTHRVTGYIIFVSLAVIMCVAILRIYTGHGVWEIHDLFGVYVIFAAMMVLKYFASLIFKRMDVAFIFLAAELFIGAYIGYGMPNFTDVFSSDPEQSGEYVEASLALKEDMGIAESTTDRIKNPDTMLNANYGMVIRRATVGGWANTARRDQLDAAMTFGYNAHFMRILDSGGTVFSDALLHVTQTLTCKDDLYSKEAYTKVKEADGYTLFDNKYVLPFVMYAKSDFDGAYDGKADPAGMTNAYYRAIYEGASGKEPDGDIAEFTGVDGIHVDSAKALYLHGGEAEEITVNGKVIPVPTIGHPDNKEYPASFNSNLLFLGIYEDEDIKISGVKGKAKVLQVDMSRLDELCKICGKDQAVELSGTACRFEAETDKAGQALIPLTFDRGFSAYVNGKKMPVKNVDDLFMGIPVEKGANTVELKFRPFGLIAGIVISIAGIILTLFVLPFFDEKRIGYAGRVLTGAVFAVALTVLYIIPIAAFIIHQILKRI